MAPDDATTLRVSKTTRDRVKRLAPYGESHDGIVRKLLDFYEQHKGSAEG